MRMLGEPARRAETERGDVPGWVLITVMTAGIVATLTGLVGNRLTGLLDNALSAVGAK